MTGAVYFPGIYMSPARAKAFQSAFGPIRVLRPKGLPLDGDTAAAAEAGLVRLEDVAWRGQAARDLEARLARARSWVATLMDHDALESVKHPAPPVPRRETTRSILADLKGRPAGPQPARPETPSLTAELSDPGAILYLAAGLERDWAAAQAGLAGARAREKDMLRAALGEFEPAGPEDPAGTDWFTPTEEMALVWLAAWQTLWADQGDWRTRLVTDVPGLAQLIVHQTTEAVFTAPTEVVMPPGLGPRPKLWFGLDLPQAALPGADDRINEALALALEDLRVEAEGAAWSVEFEAEAPAKVKEAAAALDEACRAESPPETALARIHLDVFAFPGLGLEDVFRAAAGALLHKPPDPADWPDAWPAGAGLLFSIRPGGPGPA